MPLPDLEGFFSGAVSDEGQPLTLESIREAFGRLEAQRWEPHRHLFSGTATVRDGIYHCVECGAPFEWVGGEPVLGY